jgi:hypothetical protein
MARWEIAGIALLGITVAAARGDLVPVLNPSFELPQTTYAQPGAEDWVTAGPTTFGAGVFRNLPAGQAGSISNAVGNQLAFISTQTGDELSQIVAANFEPGRIYSLSVGVAKSMVTPPQPSDKLCIELYYTANAARQPVAFTDVTNEAAANLSDSALKYFSTRSPVIAPGDAYANQPIGILFATAGAGGYLDLDNVMLTSLPQSALLGDINGDGTVNFPDLLVLAQHYGQPGGLPDGDLNADGAVGFDDLLQLAQHYGQSFTTESAPAESSVPEPLMLTAILGASLLRRRRYVKAA